MDIQTSIITLQRIKEEITILNKKRTALKKQEKELTSKISDYLKSKGQHGVKYQGFAFMVEEKETRPVKRKLQDASCLEVLKKYGVEDPLKVVQELTEIRKGDSKVNRKVKIAKLES